MSIQEYQQLVDNWIQTTGVRYFSPLTNMAILAEEVGEVGRLMARIHGDQSFKKNEMPDDAGKALADELADVFWVLTCLANQNQINLEEAIRQNLDKKNSRDSQRHKENPKLKE